MKKILATLLFCNLIFASQITVPSQPTGNYITALTGDVTASGPNSVAATVAATQANISTLSRTAGVSVHGTNTNDAPSAGYVGEVLSAAGAAVDYSNNDAFNDVASITITAGDWMVGGGVYSAIGTGVTPLDAYAGIGTASGTSATGLVLGDTLFIAGPPLTTNGSTANIPPRRYSVSGSTTLYLKGRCNRTSGTPTGSGRITAVRIR